MLVTNIKCLKLDLNKFEHKQLFRTFGKSSPSWSIRFCPYKVVSEILAYCLFETN